MNPHVNSPKVNQRRRRWGEQSEENAKVFPKKHYHWRRRYRLLRECRIVSPSGRHCQSVLESVATRVQNLVLASCTPCPMAVQGLPEKSTIHCAHLISSFSPSFLQFLSLKQSLSTTNIRLVASFSAPVHYRMDTCVNVAIEFLPLSSASFWQKNIYLYSDGGKVPVWPLTLFLFHHRILQPQTLAYTQLTVDILFWYQDCIFSTKELNSEDLSILYFCFLYSTSCCCHTLVIIIFFFFW